MDRACRFRHFIAGLTALLLVGVACAARAEDRNALSIDLLLGAAPLEAPVANAAFAPGADAVAAPAFAAGLQISAAELAVSPALEARIVDGRDAQRFPAVVLRFVSVGQQLVPLERGRMVAEQTAPGTVPGYWRVIPQIGRIWRQPGDGAWSRAAFPLMLVNDTENHAHQGLATFLYRDDSMTGVRMQFVQQTAPWLLSPPCVFWGRADASSAPLDPLLAERERVQAERELAARLPAQPLDVLRADIGAGALDGFGEPVPRNEQVALGLVRGGTLYYESAPTSYGDYPYPLEMRFGVRSVEKSVSVPLALLRLAEVYGPEVLEERIGDHVPALADPKWRRVRFIDAANMASGFGGAGSLLTHPNDMYSGYLDADYNGWYTAPSNAEKIAHINAHLRPYPWEPGTVVRYLDQDIYLLGIAVDAFLKQRRGPQADAWRMLENEVLAPIGVFQAPVVRTREANGVDGPAWFNAGWYPTLDDMAKVALLLADGGAHDGRQLLHRSLTADLLAARGSLDKTGMARTGIDAERYLMGLHYTPWTGSRSQRVRLLPTMSGFGANEAVIFPGRVVSLRAAKSTQIGQDPRLTVRVVEAVAPF